MKNQKDVNRSPLDEIVIRALYVVHWPDKDTFACEKHAAQMIRLGKALGYNLTISFIETKHDCPNCINEKNRFR